MIIGYDPVAREVELDLESGRPRLGFSREHLVVKHYADVGILFAELSSQSVELGFLPDGGSQAIPHLVPTGPLRWRVELSPLPTNPRPP